MDRPIKNSSNSSSHEGSHGAAAASTNARAGFMPRVTPQQRDYDSEFSLHGHKEPVTTIALLSDNRIVTGGADAAVIVWRALSARDYKALVALVDEEAKRSITGGIESFDWPEIRSRRDVVRERMISAELRGHESGITSISILNDGRIVSGSEDGSLRVWRERAEGSPWQSTVLVGHRNSISNVLALDNFRIVSTSRDGSVLLWTEENSGNWTHQNLPGHEKGFAVIDRFPNGKVVTGGGDGTLRVHSLREGFPNKPLQHAEEGIRAVKTLGDGMFVSLGAQTACMWRLNPETGAWRGNRLEGLIKAAILPDGGIVTFTEQKNLPEEERSGVAVWRFTDEGRWETVASQDKDWREMRQLTPLSPKTFLVRAGWQDYGFPRRDLQVIHIEEGKLKRECIDSRRFGGTEKGYIALPDGRFGVVGSDGSLCLWRGKEGKEQEEE